MERNLPKEPSKNSELILYQTEDGKIRLEVCFEGEMVWLTQLQMAELFQTSVPNINMHLRNIFAVGKLLPEATVKDFLIVQPEAAAAIRKFRIVQTEGKREVQWAVMGGVSSQILYMTADQ
ncbi:MAG: hypothetical protein ABSE95_05540 [Thermodesulfobacteriota bacterium]|jgi:hypothetical protein